jgi:hypothetical protein
VSQFEDTDKMLIKIITMNLEKFREYVHLLKSVRAEYLIHDDGFAEILNIDISK